VRRLAYLPFRTTCNAWNQEKPSFRTPSSPVDKKCPKKNPCEINHKGFSVALTTTNIHEAELPTPFCAEICVRKYPDLSESKV